MKPCFAWVCHSDVGSENPEGAQIGGTKFDLSGVGPGLGMYFASNLTPDQETDIGSWSDGELVRAIREGVDREGKMIFPIIPYQFYHGLSDGDALSLVAYIRSLDPVSHAVSENQYSFMAKALAGIRMVKPEFAVTEKITAPGQGPTAEYGEYLAWHASGCAECHVLRVRDRRLEIGPPLLSGNT